MSKEKISAGCGCGGRKLGPVVPPTPMSKVPQQNVGTVVPKPAPNPLNLPAEKPQAK